MKKHLLKLKLFTAVHKHLQGMEGEMCVCKQFLSQLNHQKETTSECKWDKIEPCTKKQKKTKQNHITFILLHKLKLLFLLLVENEAESHTFILASFSVAVLIMHEMNLHLCTSK